MKTRSPLGLARFIWYSALLVISAATVGVSFGQEVEVTVEFVINKNQLLVQTNAGTPVPDPDNPAFNFESALSPGDAVSSASVETPLGTNNVLTPDANTPKFGLSTVLLF